MRPFYEQFHYLHRPRKKVGDEKINEFVSDFLKWHKDEIEDTPHVADRATHMTAFDKLSRKDFRRNVRLGIAGSFKKTGDWPNFYEPKTFGAMNIFHALTMPMPIKQPADKLLVGDYIPEHLSEKVSTARVMKTWEPGEEISFDGIAPGTYFFKANHGSAFNIQVTLPCSDEELDHIRSEGKRWLDTNYGQHTCQWWYQFIDRKVFLEADINEGLSDEPATDFKFHVINGKIALMQMYVGRGGEAVNNPIYDADLNYLPFPFLRQNLNEEPLPENAMAARDAALELGKNEQYCRVDVYLKPDQVILGELTYLPNAGRRKILSPELDERICDLWDPMPKFVRME